MQSIVTSLLALAGSATAITLAGLPTVPLEASENGGAWHSSSLVKVIVDEAFAESRNEKGMTLIPPTLTEFAETFISDLKEVLDIEVEVEIGSAREVGQ